MTNDKQQTATKQNPNQTQPSYTGSSTGTNAQQKPQTPTSQAGGMSNQANPSADREKNSNVESKNFDQKNATSANAGSKQSS